MRDLVTEMYCVNSWPDKHLSTLVAKKLVSKYKFLADIDKSRMAREYVSYCSCYSFLLLVFTIAFFYSLRIMREEINWRILTPENFLPQKQIQKLVVLLNGVILGLVTSDSTLRFQCHVMILSPMKRIKQLCIGERIGTGESKEGYGTSTYEKDIL